MATLLLSCPPRNLGAKKGVSGGTLSHHCAGFQKHSPRSSQKCTQHAKAMPAFNLSPSQLPMEADQARFCLRALAQQRAWARRWPRVGLDGAVYGVPALRSSVFCPRVQSSPLSPCLPGPRAPGLLGERLQNCCLVVAPPVAAVQTIVIGAKRRNRRAPCWGCRGKELSPGSHASARAGPRVPAGPAPTTSKSPPHLKTCLAQGVTPCFLRPRMLSCVLVRGGLCLS